MAPFRTATEQAVVTIRNWIVEGTLGPGQHLNQDELAAALGLSRLPVREALQRLESDGLIAIAPHRGAVVAQMSAGDIEDIYTVKMAIEGTATRLGAIAINEAGLDLMATLLDLMDEASATGDWAAWLSHDREFHFTLYQASARPRLIDLATRFWDLAERYRRFSLSFPHRTEQSAEAHRAIHGACRRREADQAERIMVRALAESRDSLLKLTRGVMALRSSSMRERTAPAAPGVPRRSLEGGTSEHG